MKKRILSAILLLMPIIANAYDVEINGIYYNLNNELKEAEVTYKTSDYNSYTGAVTIPEKFTYGEIDYSVTNIGEKAFYGCSDLTSVIISNSVTSIDYAAFEACNNLTSVNIPNSVTFIGGSVFRNCEGLKKVEIGDSVIQIGGLAFAACTNLNSLSLGKSVTIIGRAAFSGCIGISSLIIPNSVKVISNSFRGCDGLKFLSIHSETVGKWFYDLPNIERIELGDSVKNIEARAFEKCSGLLSINIPKSLISIGESAFYQCSGLKKVITEDLAAWCGISFADTFSNPLYYAKHLYNNDNNEITDLVIPETVTEIKDYAFEFCGDIKSLTIPTSVNKIGVYSFAHCASLPSIILPNTITKIAHSSFLGCRNITSITIPSSVNEIGVLAFRGCYLLNYVTIPNTVDSIGNGAFENCSLKEVYCYAEEIPSTSLDAFMGSNTSQAILYVPSKSISDYKATLPWSEFGTILPLDEMDIKKTMRNDENRETRYLLDGKMINRSIRGLNIIRSNNGKSKKVIII